MTNKKKSQHGADLNKNLALFDFSKTEENAVKNTENKKMFDAQDLPDESFLKTEQEIVPEFSVSDAIALFNQMFETAAPRLKIVGEIANYKISQGKWVFFDVKDSGGSLNCFLPAFNLRTEIENGMQVILTARPKFTKWGKFSLTVEQILPIGEGSILRAFELLHTKLSKEGIFAPERKRALPILPLRIGVISSEAAAGYKDFIKILGNRFSGLEIYLFPAQVQGEKAADQIISGLNFFNESKNPPEVIAILRGGGSRDDLVAFDDEELVRAVASSRVPTIAGVGHEIDTTLVDLAADVRASTPSNAAEILVPDKNELMKNIEFRINNLIDETARKIDATCENIDKKTKNMEEKLLMNFQENERRFLTNFAILEQLNPAKILRRGFAIVKKTTGEIMGKNIPKRGEKLTIETGNFIIETEVKDVKKK